MKKLFFLLVMAIMFAMQGFAQTPLNEGFEGTTFPPDEWNTVHVSGSIYWESDNDSYYTLSGNYAQTDYGLHENWLITPKLSIESDEDSISFYVRADGNYAGTTLNVKVSTTDRETSSFDATALLTLTSANDATSDFTTSWVRHAIDLSAYNGQEIYIAFQSTDTDGYGILLMMDNVQGPNIVLPSCPKPTDLAASNPTTSSIDLSWVDPLGTASSWNIEYMLASETDWANAIPEVATTNPYTISNLLHSSTYKVRIQTDCGGEQSEWSSPITFTTPCEALTIPTTVEPFNTVPPSTCWSKAGGVLPSSGTATLTPGSGSWYSYTLEIYPGAGNNARMNVYNTLSGWLISPSIDLGEDGTLYQVEMDILLSDYANNNAPELTGTDDVFGIVVSTDNGATWDVANAILWTNQEGATRVYNNLYPMQHLSIPLEDASGNPYQGIVKIGIYAGSTT
ncbi:MAG: fibronectin type III domain-containing protein, partial [Bacteroidales bacterium]|nr:fibronectin type III domain-containing protein [Bacteroidales bacterium]